ncbi:hypothetical protein SLA2020_436490 [Shorea laevis]
MTVERVQINGRGRGGNTAGTKGCPGSFELDCLQSLSVWGFHQFSMASRWCFQHIVTEPLDLKKCSTGCCLAELYYLVLCEMGRIPSHEDLVLPPWKKNQTWLSNSATNSHHLHVSALSKTLGELLIAQCWLCCMRASPGNTSVKRIKYVSF